MVLQTSRLNLATSCRQIALRALNDRLNSTLNSLEIPSTFSTPWPNLVDDVEEIPVPNMESEMIDFSKNEKDPLINAETSA